MTVYWPSAKPIITEEAGTRGGTHAGIDLAAALNDPVLAPFAGQVVFVGGDGARAPIWLGTRWLYPNGEGLTVDIRRSDGLIARLGHLNGFAVKQGDWVTAGETIGYAGTTGYSTGVHIHWELRWDRAWVGGNWINPRTVAPQIFAPKPIIPEEEPEMLTFITSSNTTAWYATDGVTKRPLAPGEPQLLVDMGVAKYPAKPSKVHVLDPVQLARIPDQKSVLPLDTKGVVNEVLAGIRATGVKVDVDAGKVAQAVLDQAAKRLQA